MTVLSRTAARVLVDQLCVHGTDRIFCVPGESYLSVLDALSDTTHIDLVSCRHESGAAMMAEAAGKLTGRPGICMVTRGPGATNASSGLHVAMQDATPMILFVGQVARRFRGREAFQEVDYEPTFSQLAKWVVEINDPDRIPEIISRAFYIAMSGRQGPVVVVLPEDVLDEACHVADAKPYARISTGVGTDALATLQVYLTQAERPFLLLGGSGWDPEAVHNLEAAASRLALPVATTFRRQDRFNNLNENYAGCIGIGADPALIARIKESDLLIVIGARLGEMSTAAYKLIEIPNPHQRLIHAHPDPTELGRVYAPDLGIAADPRSVASALRRLPTLEFPDDHPRRNWVRVARDAATKFADTAPSRGAVDLGQIIKWISKELGEEGIITNGAGNFTTWVHRFFTYRRLGSQLAPTSGSMGYGFPAAIAAKRTFPDRTVVCVAGDGDFMMTAQELCTAVQFGIPVITIIANNGLFGTIRMHQERSFPARVIGTTLRNPDFTAYARAHGAYGEKVTSSEDFPAAFHRAKESGLPALIELVIDPEDLTISQRTSEIRAAAQSSRLKTQHQEQR